MQIYRTDLRVGEALTIDGGRTTVVLEEKSGQRARLVFRAEEGVRFTKSGASQTGAAQAAHGIRHRD